MTLLEERVRGMNAMARVLKATNADVPIGEILDIGGFDLERAVVQKPMFLEPEYPFEWAGTHELAEGSVELVLEDCPDGSMDVMLLPLQAGEDALHPSVRERAARGWSKTKERRAPGAVLETGNRTNTLDLTAPGEKRFRIHIPRPGRFGLYTEHLPREFRLRVLGSGEARPVSEKEFGAGHSHDDQVTSVGIHLEGAIDGNKLNGWLSTLLREKGTDI